MECSSTTSKGSRNIDCDHIDHLSPSVTLTCTSSLARSIVVATLSDCYANVSFTLLMLPVARLISASHITNWAGGMNGPEAAANPHSRTTMLDQATICSPESWRQIFPNDAGHLVAGTAGQASQRQLSLSLSSSE